MKTAPITSGQVDVRGAVQSGWLSFAKGQLAKPQAILALHDDPDQGQHAPVTRSGGGPQDDQSAASPCGRASCRQAQCQVCAGSPAARLGPVEDPLKVGAFDPGPLVGHADRPKIAGMDGALTRLGIFGDWSARLNMTSPRRY